jgi:hypothetical protein
VTRGNLFFLRHKNVSNPPEMTHLIQFSVVSSRVCKSYSAFFYGFIFKVLKFCSKSLVFFLTVVLYTVLGDGHGKVLG